MSLDRYNRITKVNKNQLRANPVPFIPSPTERDYQTGYIVRYFAQSVNNKSAPIIEIKREGYSKFSTNPYYNTVRLDWRLTGDREDVRKSNKTSVYIASKTMSRIKLYLPNLVQFYDPSY